MEVFVSWHGEVSRRVAEGLRGWLPCVMQGLSVFVSSKDIQKGDVWFGEISSRLNSSTVGVLCVNVG
jgi:hypothetical protein